MIFVSLTKAYTAIIRKDVSRMLIAKATKSIMSMKIVQSSWSCKESDLLRFSSGWFAPEYNLMAWALSCLQMKKYYDNVTLYADTVSARMLIDELHLPYDEVVCNLDRLNTYDKRLWALPKIHTYSIQESPFLHVDSDVFIWQPFDPELLRSALIAQNMEISTSYYENAMRSLEVHLSYFPKEILEDRQLKNPIYAYNAGIFGGHDLVLYQEYSRKAFDFVDRNTSNLSKIDCSTFNIFFEQYLFYCLVKKNNKKVNVMLSQIVGDDEYVGFGDFIEVPHNKKFLHLLGVYKRNPMVCEQMADRLRLDHPEFYYRIIALFKKNGVGLKKDFYFFTDILDEQRLIKNYKDLKGKFSNSDFSILANNSNEKANPVNNYRFRIPLINDVINSILEDKLPMNNYDYGDQLSDLARFENNLADIIENKFSAYSTKYLYARDITHTQYFQEIFQDVNTGFTRKLIVDDIFVVIETNYDWSEVHLGTIGERKMIQQLDLPSSMHQIAIIPECDITGYSLINIDDLDIRLLQILQHPISLNEILLEASHLFNADELKECYEEFELLITGRIKTALRTKLIKIKNEVSLL